MIKKLFIVYILAVCSSLYAGDYTIEDKGDTLLIKENCDCFPQKMIGMMDNNEQSISRSKKEGVALQYVLFNKPLYQSLNIDSNTLTDNFNNYSHLLSKFFKKHQDLKGTFITIIDYFPGYKNPFQFNSTNPQIQKLNQAIKEDSQCSPQGFCSSLIFTETIFDDKKQTNFHSYIPELSQYLENDNTHIPNPTFSNKNNLKPVRFVLIYGTNGYLTTVNEVKSFLQKIK